MTDNFYPLTCDDDLLLIDQDTFTVSRFFSRFSFLVPWWNQGMYS